MSMNFRTVFFMMMFGIFMSNNVIVPVHQLSHIHEAEGEHETELVNCEVFHASPTLAILNSGFAAFLPRNGHTHNLAASLQLIIALPKYSTHIRAPPQLA